MAYDSALVHYTITNICFSQEGGSQLVQICRHRVCAREHTCVLRAVGGVDTSDLNFKMRRQRFKNLLDDI